MHKNSKQNIGGQEFTDTERLAAEIFQTARTIALAGDETDIGPLVHSLEDAVTQCLHTRQEDPLSLALEAALREQDNETFDEIHQTIQAQASCVTLGDPNSYTSSQAYLFTIPLILETPGQGLPRNLDRYVDVAGLTESITASGLMDGAPEIIFDSRLYTQAELDEMSPTDVYHFCRRLKNKISTTRVTGDAGEVVEHMYQSHVPGSATTARKVVLRHIVGIFVDRDGVNPFTTHYESDLESAEVLDFAESMANWQRDMEEAVRERLYGPQSEKMVCVGVLDNYYMSKIHGEHDFQIYCLNVQLEDTISLLGVPPHELRAVMAPYGKTADADEIRVGIASIRTGELLTGLVFQLDPSDETETVFHTLGEMLDNAGIFAIYLVRNCQPILESQKTLQECFMAASPDAPGSYAMQAMVAEHVLH